MFIARVELGQWGVFNTYGDLVKICSSRSAAEHYINFYYY